MTAVLFKLRRGTTTEHSTFTGQEAEVTVDTTKDTLVVHDGATAGGFPLAKETTVASSISAAGTTQGTATALTKDLNIITTVASNSGVVLPTATVGRRIVIVNKGANILNIYPATGATIDALSANAAIQVAANGTIQFMAPSTTQWYSISRVAIYDASGNLLN